ncbi:ATP-binding protein [bacterium]|nr:ATP-binding protein [bacterium]
MIRKINLIHYRRLKNIELYFSPNVNVVSGLNGTCKSSILYLISNAFQAETNRSLKLVEPTTLSTLNALTDNVNKKIETLTKGDKEYNDPAYGVSGPLYSIEYLNDIIMKFRRHNTKTNARFRLAPMYSAGEKLPVLRIVYLNLSRLVPYGEIADTVKGQKKSKQLPEKYTQIFHDLVKEILNISIQESKPEVIDGIKTRSDYKTNSTGIDSNTSSAGEDNVIIILHNLVLLQYYYDQLDKEKIDDTLPQSILLIDELDATLHPALQVRLANLIINYSADFKIQVFFTTHSLYLIEHMFKRAQVRINYLTHQDDHVTLLPEPTIEKIERHLQESLTNRARDSHRIPIFSEDPEARKFIDALFAYYKENCKYFQKVSNKFHFVEANIGCNTLRALFTDSYLDRNTMNAICILDGDGGDKNTKKNIIVLPGKKSPENLIFDYITDQYQNNGTFWNSAKPLDLGFTKQRFKQHILPKIESIQETVTKSGKKEREVKKQVFNEDTEYYQIVIDHWVKHNFELIQAFYYDLNFCFRQVALLHNIDPDIWPKQSILKNENLT